MKDEPGRELSTIAKLWAAFITMVRTEWARIVNEPWVGRVSQAEKDIEDDRPNENWYWKSEIFWG